MYNAAGEKAPPLIIYKGLHVWDQWLAPPEAEYPGTVYASSKNGWMETAIFKNYFLKTIIPTVGNERPVLIIYDGHSTHIDVETIEAAMRENITILKLPPHSSHLLQPLDISVFKSINSRWDEKLSTWQRQHIGQKLSKKLFTQFLGDVWKSLNPEIIKNGFRKAGIYPFCRNIIAETEFPPHLLRKWKEAHTEPETEGINEPADNDVREPVDTGEVTVIDTETVAGPSNESEEQRTAVSFEELLLTTIKQPLKLKIQNEPDYVLDPNF